MLGVCSIAYQAPEIWLNDLRGNGKSDVFALGVSLYEVFEAVRLIVLPQDIMQTYNTWVNSKGNDEVHKVAFLRAMRTWHGNERNHTNFKRLAIGENLQSYACMHEFVPAAIRRMLTVDTRQRPTARQLYEMLQPPTRTTADSSTCTSPTLTCDTGVQPTFSRGTAEIVDSGTQRTSSLRAAKMGPTMLLEEAAQAFGGLTQLAANIEDSDEAMVDPPAQSEMGIAETVQHKYGLEASQRDIAAVCALIALTKRQMKLGGDVKASHLIAKLQRKSRPDQPSSSEYRRAMKIFEKLQAADTQHKLTYEERMVLAIVLEQPVERKLGATNPHRALYQALTRRTRHWWKKNVKGTTMKLTSTTT